MKFMVSGWNDFYDGYLARIFEQDDDERQNVAWRLGWKTADETPPTYRGAGFIEELRRTNHIKVKIVKNITYEEILGAIVMGWSTATNAHKEMDVDLAEAIAIEVHTFLNKQTTKDDDTNV